MGRGEEFLLLWGFRSKGDTGGKTPLHAACRNGHDEVVVHLLETGKADVKAKDKDGNTPLHAACRNGHEEIVNILLEVDETDFDWYIVN